MPSFQANGTLKPNRISSQVKCLMTVQDVISSQVGMIRSIFTWILMTQLLASNSRTFLVFFQVRMFIYHCQICLNMVGNDYLYTVHLGCLYATLNWVMDKFEVRH